MSTYRSVLQLTRISNRHQWISIIHRCLIILHRYRWTQSMPEYVLLTTLVMHLISGVSHLIGDRPPFLWSWNLDLSQEIMHSRSERFGFVTVLANCNRSHRWTPIRMCCYTTSVAELRAQLQRNAKILSETVLFVKHAL